MNLIFIIRHKIDSDVRDGTDTHPFSFVYIFIRISPRYSRIA